MKYKSNLTKWISFYSRLCPWFRYWMRITWMCHLPTFLWSESFKNEQITQIVAIWRIDEICCLSDQIQLNFIIVISFECIARVTCVLGPCSKKKPAAIRIPDVEIGGWSPFICGMQIASVHSSQWIGFWKRKINNTFWVDESALVIYLPLF